MSMNRIAAAATVMVLGVSGVALAQGGIDLSAEQSTEASANANVPASVPSSNAVFGLSVAAEATSNTSTSATRPTTTTIDDRTRRDFATTTTIDDRSRRDFATTTTIDDRSRRNSATTSTTIDDDSNERRATVELGLRTYTVGEAGTVTVNGLTLLAVDANAGWTVEVNEVSTDRIKVRFHQGEQRAEFELRIDGELRIRSAHS